MGSARRTRLLDFSDWAGSAARSTRLTWLVLSEAVRRSVSSEARGEGVGLLVLEPGVFILEVDRFVELGDQRRGDDPVDCPVEDDAGVGDVEDLAADVIPDGFGASANPPVPPSAFDQGVDNLGP